MRRPLIIGHRGFAARYPDNSVAGVEAALAVGADGAEVDIRPAADGRWVCHHDLRCRRAPIGEWTSTALRSLGVPLLEEILDAVPATRWLFVEVKPLSHDALLRNMDSLAALLSREPRFLRVISSSLPVLGEVERAMPGVALSWVFGELPQWLPTGMELSPRHSLVEKLLAAGRPLHPWTVNREDRMRRLGELGAASITTNRPDLAVEAVGG